MEHYIVDLKDRSYPILIGSGILTAAAETALNSCGGTPCRVCVAGDSHVRTLYSQRLEAALKETGFSVVSFSFEPGECSKCLPVLEQLCSFLLQNQFGRHDMLIALGGGVTGDLVGFAAAVYMRGIPYIQIPTSLIAQIDSSVGGKTAVDFGGVKNILGAFHQPAAVVADVSLLETLSSRVLQDGLGEMVKYAFLKGGSFYDTTMSMERPEDFYTQAQALVSECVLYKKGVVERDEKEQGERMLLNLGHTLGHCIESYHHYLRYTHGEAVAVGMAEMLRYAVQYHGADPAFAKDGIALLRRLKLPTVPDTDRTLLYERVLHDKKGNGKELRIVVPFAPGDVRILRIEKTLFLEQVNQLQQDW